MKNTLTEEILQHHLVEGSLEPGSEIGLKIDQTLTQDATGTMVYLEFESLGMDTVQPEVAVSYIDHNIIQTDYKNADDHRFLQSSAARYGVTLSPAGNGVSHHVHRQRFGIPGKTLLGSDSHTTTGGCLSMLAMGAGGLEVAMAMAGRPYYITSPRVWGIYVENELQPFVSGKDVILELLRRYSVKGGLGTVMEFYGPGVENLDMAARATIANMAVDIGATAAMFPSDEVTRDFMRMNGREEEWIERPQRPEGEFEFVTEIDLSSIEPMVAMPSNPDNVKPARELGEVPVHQVIIGSSCNGSYRDFMTAAHMVDGHVKAEHTNFEVNTGSRQTLVNLLGHGGLQKLIGAGARVHEPGCLGCIGMGQAPATGTNSLRTFPRNFKGRSGTKEDFVYLCSPETAAASALSGYITDPRTMAETRKPDGTPAPGTAPVIEYPERFAFNEKWFMPAPEDRNEVEILRGPNIKPFPEFEELPDNFRLPVSLKVGDNISTDTIMPAGNRVLPYRSNIPAISGFVYDLLDKDFPERAQSYGNSVIVGGHNYGQGSSREHAAIAPRHLGVRVKIAKSFARIHKANLVNFGILPLEFANPEDYELIQQGKEITLPKVRELVESGATEIPVEVGERRIITQLTVSERQRRMLVAGGALNIVKQEKEEQQAQKA
jgi:aconitate hydratase